MKVIALDVVELVVEAFRVAKFAVLPKSVPTVAEVKLAMAANRLDNTFRFVIVDVAATSEFVLMFVEVELVIVELVTISFTIFAFEIFDVEELEVVAKVVEA